MQRLFQSFLANLVAADDQALAQQVLYLKEENQILRARLPQRLQVTHQERQRLLKYGRPLGSAIRDFISIVSPRTFLRWVHEERKPPTTTHPKRRPGRPRTAEAVRTLILRIAAETGFGYTRILGELKKLGIRSVSRATVVNILREHGYDPGPKRGEGTWDEFIRRHAQTLWACDFFTANVWTLQGLVPIFVFFFLHVGSRRVHIAGMTAHPDAVWMKQQVRNMALVFAEQTVQPQFLIRDLDSKFTSDFDDILAAEGLEMVTVGPRKPNLNAFAERWVQSMRQECLAHFVICGEAHLRHLVSTYVAYYNQLRPHQARDNLPLDGREPPVLPLPPKHEIVCDEQLGGLLKSYRRAA